LRLHNDSSSNVMFRNENANISKFTVHKTIRRFEETRRNEVLKIKNKEQ